MRITIVSLLLSAIVLGAFAMANPPTTRPGPKLLGGMPSLVARDITALAEFYRDKCGFKVEWVWGEPAAYAIISRDELRLAIAPRTDRFGPTRAYVFVTDADGLHDALVTGGAKLNGRPETQSYNMRDFTLTDPEGNEICFGQDVSRVGYAGSLRTISICGERRAVNGEGTQPNCVPCDLLSGRWSFCAGSGLSAVTTPADFVMTRRCAGPKTTRFCRGDDFFRDGKMYRHDTCCLRYNSGKVPL